MSEHPQYPNQPQYPQPSHQQYPSGQTPYGQPVSLYQVQQPPRGMSITSMVLGLASLVLGFTFLVPIIGFIFGVLGLKKEPAGRGMAIAGLILNGLFLVGWAMFIAFIVFVAGLAAYSSPSMQNALG